MCMEDVRIARATATSAKQVTVPASTWTLLVPANPDRYSISVSLIGATGWIFQCGSNGTPDLPGLLAPTGSTPMLFDLQQHGDMVRQPWYVYQTTASAIAYVTETFLGIQ